MGLHLRTQQINSLGSSFGRLALNEDGSQDEVPAPAIVFIDLSNNRLEGEGGSGLVALTKLPALQSVNLAANHLGPSIGVFTSTSA